MDLPGPWPCNGPPRCTSAPEPHHARRPDALSIREGDQRRGEARKLPSGRIYPPGGRTRIETDRYREAVATEGYVSGVAAGSFLDKQTGARDLGFGLSIVDFLLEPAPEGEPVPRASTSSGTSPRRPAEALRRRAAICTMAKRLPATVTVSPDFASVRLNYRWNLAYPPAAAPGRSGSRR